MTKATTHDFNRSAWYQNSSRRARATAGFCSVVCLVLSLLTAASAMAGAQQISPTEAIDHVGEDARVCGIVASAQWGRESRGKPTFLNLGKPYPDHVFTGVIWAESRSAFSYPPEGLEGENICIEGTVRKYRGKAQMIIDSPDQISAWEGA